MKYREISLAVVIFAYAAYKLVSHQYAAAIIYILASSVLKLDSDIIPYDYSNMDVNQSYHHRFIPIWMNKNEADFAVTYHIMECGSPETEAVVLFHDIFESNLVWKPVLRSLCDTYQVIAVDIDGHGQSSSIKSTSHTNSTHIDSHTSLSFIRSETYIELLDILGVDRFNLIVAGYGFDVTFGMLQRYSHRILRYGKLQSPVGVEDGNRDILRVLAMNSRYSVWLDRICRANPRAFARILLGQPIIKLPGLSQLKWTGTTPIDHFILESVVLTEISHTSCDVLSSYRYHDDLVTQISSQQQIFQQLRCPVLLMQGDSDISQPMSLYDGSIEQIFTPMYNDSEINHPSINRHLVSNGSHFLSQQLTRSPSIDEAIDSNTIMLSTGRTVIDYFPSSSWVKMYVVPGAGHFLSLEAPDTITEAILELLSLTTIS